MSCLGRASWRGVAFIGVQPLPNSSSSSGSTCPSCDVWKPVVWSAFSLLISGPHSLVCLCPPVGLPGMCFVFPHAFDPCAHFHQAEYPEVALIKFRGYEGRMEKVWLALVHCVV